MFVLCVSFVTAVVMVAATIMSSFVIPLLTWQVKPNIDMTVAGDLVVAQFVICGKIISPYGLQE